MRSNPSDLTTPNDWSITHDYDSPIKRPHPGPPTYVKIESHPGPRGPRPCPACFPSEVCRRIVTDKPRKRRRQGVSRLQDFQHDKIELPEEDPFADPPGISPAHNETLDNHSDDVQHEASGDALDVPTKKPEEYTRLGLLRGRDLDDLGEDWEVVILP